MIRTEKEIIENFINELRAKILWNQASLKSIDLQLQERGGLLNSADDFSFQKVKNEILNSIEIDTRMLEIFRIMLKEKKENATNKTTN